WQALRNIQENYKRYRAAEVAARRYRPIPEKEGHFRVLNQYMLEDALVDYRVLIDFKNGGSAYKVVSCLLCYEEEGFETVEAAYRRIREIVENIRDEGGFSLSIVEEDDEKVYDYMVPPEFRQVMKQNPIEYPTDDSQNDW
ncbi:MAG: hypothetical protein ACE5KV_08320, partial [Thermoplasmata archaeon]